MKNSRLLPTLIILLSLLNSFFLIPKASSYWGWGDDCRQQHGYIDIAIPYDKNANIILDGIPSETFWQNPNNTEGRTTIPLASAIGSPDFFIVYLNLTFVRNDEYIFILCHWEDNTTRPGPQIKDGLYFCWNINVPNFSAGFTFGMDTTIMGGGDVDGWGFECKDTSPPNQSSFLGVDDCFGESGWYHSAQDLNDVSVGYSYITNKSYTVEMKRKLITNDGGYDVQFNEEKLYEFNLGLLDDGKHEDHAISWTCRLNLLDDIKTLNNTSPIHEAIALLIPIMSLIFITLTVGVIILIQIKKKKTGKR